jgi:hypothetical protein
MRYWDLNRFVGEVANVLKYVCTIAERDHPLEMWKLLDPHSY